MSRRKVIWHVFRGVVALSLAAMVVTACASNQARSGAEDDDGRLSVMATTSIIGALAREVAGEQADVSALIGPGVDPHVYSPAPGDIRDASDADLALANGIGLDDVLVDNIRSANPDIPVVIVTEGIELREGGHQHEDETHEEDEHHTAGDGHDHGAHDPHVWQDPFRAMQMVDNIAAALADADPGNAGIYEQNAAAYKATLEETHAEIEALIAKIPPENRKLVTNHDSLGYFADRYGLDVVATVIPNLSTDADPSARQIAELADMLEDENIPAIFTEQLVNPTIAEQLANDTGVRIVSGLYTDAIGEPGTPAATLHGMLLENARTISEALR